MRCALLMMRATTRVRRCGLSSGTASRGAPTVMAAIYGALEDKTQAFASLNKAFRERDFLLVLLNVEPMFDPLRSDSRFVELTRRVGLPQ